MASFEEALRVAVSLNEPEEVNDEYRRGQIELLANLFGIEGMSSGDRAESIEQWMTAMQEVEDATRKNPGTSWEPMAVGFTGPSGGVVAFARPYSEVRDDPFDRSCGTAEFKIEGEAISFFWGHYDLSPEMAMTDYRERMKR